MIKCDEKTLYRSKDIVFQKWVNFVVNYNHGTLDLFMDTNLVLTQKMLLHTFKIETTIFNLVVMKNH